MAENNIEKAYIELVKKYDTRSSFYTDYPAVGLWDQVMTDEDFKKNLLRLKENPVPLFLYVHYPYCEKQCFYCQCYSLITSDKKKMKIFMDHILKEMDILINFFKENNIIPNIQEIHLGGGSPSYIDEENFDLLCEKFSMITNIKKLAEFAMEIDPRTVTKEKMIYYSNKGITRISFGVQDFDINVQKAINRIQPPEMIENLLSPELRKLFRSVNFDIIYGLPLQTEESFKKTIETVIKLSPDRIALCIMGWRPDLYKNQRLFIKEEDLPSNINNARLNFNATMSLINAGYEKIGIDHFAKSTDDLAIAKRKKTMHRNAMGYTPGRCVDQLGIGPSSMGRLFEYYFQNHYDIEDYYRDIDKNMFPKMRGYKLTKDDIIRRDLMYTIINYSYVNFEEFGKKYSIDFKEYFKEELGEMDEFVNDGILELTENEIKITFLGGFFHRFVCRLFDAFLKKGKNYKHSRETAKV